MSDTSSPTSRSPFASLRIALGIAGILTLVLGIIILVWPDKSLAVVAGFAAAVVASYLIVAGLVYIALSLFSGAHRGWSRVGHIVLGLLYIAAGVIMFTNFFASTVFLATFVVIFLGISWIIEGVVALTLLGRDGSRVWTMLYAVLSIVAGITVAFSPLYAAAVLWWVLGIALVALGLVQIVRAITFGKDATDIRAGSAASRTV